VHGFQGIDLHQLHPFLAFLEICASIGQYLFYREVNNDDGNMHRKFQVNPFYHLGDMEKTSLLHEAILNYYKISTGKQRRSYKRQCDGEMGQKVRYYSGKVNIGPRTHAYQQEDNRSTK